MGEYAEMMLDGTLCECCGEYIGNSTGFPGYCSPSCAQDRSTFLPQKEVEARLIDGSEAYPHRPDLSMLPFWKCDICSNFVGCHHKTKDRTKPLGNIPTKELKNARQHIHKILDPLWKTGTIPRGKIYAKIARALGIKEYHTAEIKTIEEAREVYKIVKELK